MKPPPLLHPRASTLLITGALLALSCSGAPPERPPLVAPTHLSETGLYSDFANRTLAPGVRVLQPRYELWSDGAEKARWVLIPEGAQIDTSDMDGWIFPIGTKAWKQFTRDGRPVETRLLWKVEEGEDGWIEMAYAWNEEDTEATAAPDGVVDARGTPHDVPAQKACGSCHDGVRDVLLGASALQLSAEGGSGALTEWAKAGLLSHPPGREFEVPGEGTVKAALGYLHGNCAHCHNDRDALAEKRKLRLEVKTTETAPEQTGVYRTAFNLETFHEFEGSTRVIVPGSPDESQLLLRSQHRDGQGVNASFGFQMPPTCTEAPDVEGNATLRAWIQQL